MFTVVKYSYGALVSFSYYCYVYFCLRVPERILNKVFKRYDEFFAAALSPLENDVTSYPSLSRYLPKSMLRLFSSSTMYILFFTFPRPPFSSNHIITIIIIEYSRQNIIKMCEFCVTQRQITHIQPKTRTSGSSAGWCVMLVRHDFYLKNSLAFSINVFFCL